MYLQQLLMFGGHLVEATCHGGGQGDTSAPCRTYVNTFKALNRGCETFLKVCGNVILWFTGWRPAVVVQRGTGKPVVEELPFDIKLKLALLHQTWLGSFFVESALVRKILQHMTISRGEEYDAPESRDKIPVFVKAYRVDLRDVDKPLDAYSTLNKFFYREHRQGARPISAPGDPTIVVQPCDSRVLVFESVRKACHLWIKGNRFSVERLLGPCYTDEWSDCSVAISRLAPEDHHWFYAPVEGQITRQERILGEHYSVKPVVVNSVLDVFGSNKRTVVGMRTGHGVEVLVVVVSAAEVGAIRLLSEGGQRVNKGQALGHFAYGGSCVITLFRSRDIEFDRDLLDNSSQAIETLVTTGTSMGRLVRN